MAEEAESTTDKPTSVDIFYDRSPQFRIITPSGAWAGITPDAAIQVLFYTNLTPAPEYVRQELIDEHRLGKELDAIRKEGISREYEIGLVLNPLFAHQMIQLLKRMIKELPPEILSRVEQMPQSEDES